MISAYTSLLDYGLLWDNDFAICVCVQGAAHKGPSSQSYSFSMYGCESRTIKKALWCWRRLLRVLWTARRSSQSILKEISGFPGGSPGKESPAMWQTWVQSPGKIPWRRKWQPTPVFLLGEFHEQRSLVGWSPWGHKESDTTEYFHFLFQRKSILNIHWKD